MKKEKWILNEIDIWERESIINVETANMLKNRYETKKNTNILIIIFSIIGALFIGAGLILIFAKNWYDTPLFLRVAEAFFPLLISEALAVFVLKYRFEKIAWREATAILNTASIFTVIAMVGQIFHLSGEFGGYALICGLLILPMIYILDAASPLLVYYWSIISWAATNRNPTNAMILLGLFTIGALYLVFKRKQQDKRLTYLMWLTVTAGFIVNFTIGTLFDSDLILVSFSYFLLLISIIGLPDSLLKPCKILGTLGSLTILVILTYDYSWKYSFFNGNFIGQNSVLIGVILLTALFFSIKVFKYEKFQFSFIIIIAVICIMRFIHEFSKDFNNYDLFFVVVSNIALLLVGIGFIVHGTKNINLLTTNIGLTTTCLLILMRFFDSNMDFFWRGVIFLILGTVFLLVNLRILRVKKRNKKGVE